MSEPRTPSRRSVVRGVAWSVPVVSVAATAPAFAASPNVSVLQNDCATFTSGFNSACAFVTFARVTWQITTTLAIPVGTVLRVTASRELHCRHNRTSGSLRAGGFVAERSSSAEGTMPATYPVIKEIPPGTHTFQDGFAVDTGTPTLVTLTVPTIVGEGKTSDNSAGRNLRTSLGVTTCAP